ncbi:hypothetical protein GS504_02575 [Rhodococcus hoagii]|uniref:hypothetical protein n=1 Tax=Rhodococcus hoagii TaxID=43767 RepID=UPI000A1075E3|nr:hypothetical protein [Prescottella equi]MCD7053122.1 hypothetical protein [Rhodococcus sp. BH2-1]NKR30102.1 hypothetical protein [Prescottella equi]NKR30323.1 hypothetical protein [Prescottella equi]NKS56474.1 hypothetical protein [Prescottella equi]NKS61611.1 hypothetical protein [Prescottella equi]
MMAQQENVDLRIRDEVRRIWGEWVGMDPQLSPEQRAERIEQEAARLTQMVEETVGESGHGFLLDQWRAEHPGVTPDYETVVSLMGAAWESARSKVLSEELYPQVTEEVYQRVTATDELIEQERQQRIESARQEQDPERWKTLNVEVSPLAETIVNRVWMGESGRFTLLAQSLIQQRLEDNEPTPVNAVDPLADQLGAIIAAEIEAHPTQTPF